MILIQRAGFLTELIIIHDSYPIGTSSQLGRARLAAEEGWLGLGRDLNIAVQIFRLGGIYGPGRRSS